MGQKLHLLSWNVNGIRAVYRKGFMDWLAQVQPDILCLQEVRATPDQLPHELANIEGYHAYWNSAEKKGYSGVGILTKEEPIDVVYGLGVEEFDLEGRLIIAEYQNFTLFNCYFPSGNRGLTRVDYKMAFNYAFLETLEGYRNKAKPVIFCGDVNIAHNEIDLTHAKANENTSGFLPIEREWLNNVVNRGYIDTFRHLYPDVTERYSWWTARGGARQKNVGWRIDYFFVSNDFLPAIKDATILHEVMGSDHCPVGLHLEWD